MILLSLIYSCILWEIILSNSFPMQFRMLMGLYLAGLSFGLFGFGIILPMACFLFLGKYSSFRQLSKTLYGMVSSPGLVLFLNDFRAFVVSSMVMVLEYSSNGGSGALWGFRGFHGFSPSVDFHFVLVVEIHVCVGSVDLGQLGGKGVGSFVF